MARKAAQKGKKPAARKASRKPARSAPSRAARSALPKWKPPNQQQLVASLVFRNAGAAIEFYKAAFGAQELMRMAGPGGRIGHAELRIGDTVLYVNDDMGSMGFSQPAGPDVKPTATFMLYVPDCDATFDRAVKAGARPGMPLADMFWGDRYGNVVDPFGQVWGIATHVKDMSPEEMRKGAEEFAAKMRSPGAQPSPMP